MIQIIITDGDSQEINQLDAAIDEFFPEAKRVRCGYHIVNRGWDDKIEKFRSFPPSQTQFYEKVKIQIHTWIYSRMKSECQTKNEYLVYKILFKKFSRDSDIRDKLGIMFITNIETFHKNNVEVHERRFYFRRC